MLEALLACLPGYKTAPMAGWLVARTQSSRERWAAENVTRQGAIPYLPQMALRVMSRGVPVIRAQCLFPGFLFIENTGQWHFLLGTYGIRDLIMMGQNPAIVSEAEIAKIRALENNAGLVVLPDRAPGMRAGDRVRVKEGLMEGYSGIYQGTAPSRRKKVLLDFLGSKRSVLIPDSFLELVE